MNEAALQKRFVSDKEAAAVFGLSRSWFQRARWRGDGPPFIKIGAAVRYDLDTLQGWFASRSATSTSQAVES